MAKHSLMQEEGFTPHDIYPQQRFSPKTDGTPAQGAKWRVEKWTPFLKPAVEANIQSFFSQIDQNLNRAIKRS